MRISTRLIPAAALACSLHAVAQGPVHVTFSPGYSARDVAVIDNDVVVVGTTNAYDVFRWTLSSNIETGLGVAIASPNVNVSDDGTKITAKTLGIDGIDRASRWVLGSGWTQLPGLGGISGTSESTPYGISGDGQTVVGLGYSTSGAGRCYRWNATTGVQDLGGLHGDPASRANATNVDGTVIAGWKSLLNGQRQGAYWVNGVLQPQFTWVDPSNMLSFRLGEAFATNSSGTTIVGHRIMNAPASLGAHAWRWDAGQGTRLLPNLPGATDEAIPTGVTDDGQIIVGHNGAGTGVIWVNDVPQRLASYLAAQGLNAVSTSYPAAIDREGRAICGGGWVVIFPSAIEIGVPSCLGDGTAIACPCGNNSAPGAEEGCLNSFGQGAKLTATGGASLTADTVVLTGRQMPNAPALYFQGTGLINGGTGAAFGDGLRCAGGTLVRLKQITNANGTSHYPDVGDPSLSVGGQVVAPGNRTYQVWYRNSAVFCTADVFNLSNGLVVTWGP